MTLIAVNTAAALVHKAAYIQHHTHCASDKQPVRPNQNKKKENTFSLCYVSLQGDERLNRDHNKGVVVEEREINLQIPWVQACAALQMTPSPFWDSAQGRLAVSYRHFGTTIVRNVGV
jgi:hypothetical protein